MLSESLVHKHHDPRAGDNDGRKHSRLRYLPMRGVFRIPDLSSDDRNGRTERIAYTYLGCDLQRLPATIASVRVDSHAVLSRVLLDKRSVRRSMLSIEKPS